jgi:adenosylcobinamide amidohydrolase
MITTDWPAPNRHAIEFLHQPDYIALRLPGLWPILSSAVLNGGFSTARSLLNLRVDANAPPPWPPAAQTLQQQAQQLHLSAPCCGMMTAASMQSLGYARSGDADVTAECWVTAGLANLRRPGDRADAPPRAGTINIWLLVHQPLTPAAMAEALIQLTEAKVTAIRDLHLLSPVSGLPASGTGTDSHAVICPPANADSPALAFCGKHTRTGEHIGLAVLQACQHSLQQCLSVAD